MSQTPSFLQNLPEKLSQPTSIAVMASVGIHAVLGLTLPPLLSRAEPQPSGNVQLLELTPLELSRLPDSTPPLDALPPLPSQPAPLSFSSLPRFPLPPSPSNPLPPIANSSNNSSTQNSSRKSLTPAGGSSIDDIERRFRSRGVTIPLGKGTRIFDPPHNNLRGANGEKTGRNSAQRPPNDYPPLGDSDSNTPQATRG
ncbi:MAG: hypothetical protein WA919_12620, partial [Coleofasciculaceae cyanobacterium]